LALDHPERPLVRSALLTAILVLSLIGPGLGCAQEVEHEPILLVATPDLRDPNFEHTVVLVLFPKGVGPLGVILNRPIPATLKDAFPDEPQLRERTEPLFFGGPVSATALMYLFRGKATAEGAFPVLDDLCLSGNGDLLDRILAARQSSVQRYFLGYSGWAPVQLDMEIAQGGWYVLPADRETILNMDPTVMWRELLARATAVKT
jgi:putative transcriptional regulator